jgi:hypothetical protein
MRRRRDETKKIVRLVIAHNEPACSHSHCLAVIVRIATLAKSLVRCSCVSVGFLFFTSEIWKLLVSLAIFFLCLKNLML